MSTLPPIKVGFMSPVTASRPHFASFRTVIPEGVAIDFQELGIVRTALTDTPAFAAGDVDLVYLGPLTEHAFEQIRAQQSTESAADDTDPFRQSSALHERAPRRCARPRHKPAKPSGSLLTSASCLLEPSG